jgi:hypothetical protein
VGESMDQIPAPFANAWDELLGPFYRVSGMAQWLGVSERVVRYRISTRQLIGLKTTDRIFLVPSFQFDADGHVPEGLREIVTAMDPDGIDPWGDALLLRERRKEFGDRSSIEALRAHQYDEVLAFANELGRELRNLFPPPSRRRGG